MYLGDDLPDPGLVLAGTKCAEGKVRPKGVMLTSIMNVSLGRGPPELRGWFYFPKSPPSQTLVSGIQFFAPRRKSR